MSTQQYPLLVLTLPGDDSRRAKLVTDLQSRSISFELFFGVDGRSGLDPRYESLIDRNLTLIRNRRHFSDGEYACALSHLQMYETIVSSGLPGAVILEDDAVIGDGFAEFVQQQGYLAADMVLLGHHRTFVRARPPRPLPGGSLGYRIAVPPCGTYGYTVSRRAAQMIRMRGLPLSKNADWPCDISRLDAIVAHPTLVDFERSHSYIAGDRASALRSPEYPRFSWMRRMLILDDWFRLFGRLSGRPLK